MRIKITTRAERPSCPGCGGGVWHHDDGDVELADLPCFGRRTRLVLCKSRWRCPNTNCTVATFVEVDDRIAADRAGITDGAGRWATFQVGHHGRASEVPADLGCDWHTVMDAVNHHAKVLIDDPNRVGNTVSVGLDQVLLCRDGPFKHRLWSTQVVDVARGQLIEIRSTSNGRRSRRPPHPAPIFGRRVDCPFRVGYGRHQGGHYPGMGDDHRSVG